MKPVEVLQQYWGYDQFRPLQEEIVNSAIEGHDVLALLPTGGGKSICYQVPGLAMDGLTLVISPLIALMRDQVQQLQNRKIKANAIYSGLNRREIDIVLDNCTYGNYKFLYVSPERLLTPMFQERIKKMKINLVAIDESHCISLWGYDFRPPYMRIAEIRKWLPDVPFMAVTATATRQVKEDIISKLELQSPKIFTKSFSRDNISYAVRKVFNKMEMSQVIFNKVAGSAIIYVNSRKATRETANYLNSKGISTDFYHAGLTDQQRAYKQQQWIKNQIRVMVATNAFGMGIDKPDVRTVIHLHIPSSPEAYYQEAGRAGRDGKKSYSIILCNPSDEDQLHQSFEWQNPEFEFIQRVYQALANYLRVGVGSSENVSYDFDLADFCHVFDFNSRKVFFALNKLESEGLISLNEPFRNPSRVWILINKTDLYKFQVEQSRFDPLIKILLRLYGGELFSQFIKISESKMAQLLNIKEEEIIKGLMTLHKLQIIDYDKQKDKPQIIFLTQRYDANSLPIDKKLIKSRLVSEKEKIHTMLEYINNDQRCRNQILLEYFDEINYQKCGICDTCVSQKKKSDITHHDQYKSQILKLLETGPLDIESLESEIGIDVKEEVEVVIKELLDENKIQYNSQWQLILIK